MTAPSITVGNSVGMSADGRVICAIGSGVRPNISTNFGQTWNLISDTNLSGFYGSGAIAISANGSKIFLVVYSNQVPKTSICVSPDSGATLQKTSFPDIVGFYTNYVVACSADGSGVFAAQAGLPIMYSTNAGLNCYTSSAPSLFWKSVACSGDGRRVVAAAANGIYLSDDSGVTWALQTNLPSRSWNAVCVSGDGKWIGAAATVNSFISNDSGTNWQTVQDSGGDIACSADATNWVIANTGAVYTSTNGTLTWQNDLSGNSLVDVAMSADGREVVASSGRIWLGSETPHPQLNIQPQSPGVALSWILPSTNFVLQQSADLSDPNWTTVPTTPTLNLTNLQQQVTVPTAESNTFFRLIAQ